MIGCLGNVLRIDSVPNIPFLEQTQRTKKKRAKNRRSTKINEKCIKDLLLMSSFLDLARNGIDLNLLEYRKPTHVYRIDSYQAGMGGYTHKGCALRLFIFDYL